MSILEKIKATIREMVKEEVATAIASVHTAGVAAVRDKLLADVLAWERSCKRATAPSVDEAHVSGSVDAVMDTIGVLPARYGGAVAKQVQTIEWRRITIDDVAKHAIDHPYGGGGLWLARKKDRSTSGGASFVMLLHGQCSDDYVYIPCDAIGRPIVT